MSNKKMDDLIVNFITNNISEQELLRLNKWLENSDNRTYFDNYIKINYLVDVSTPFNKQDSWIKIKNKINAKNRKIKTLAYKFTAAASIVLFISFLIYFNNDRVKTTDLPVVENNTIEVGTNKATLTLQDGTEILLQKGKEYKNNNLDSNGEKIVYNPSSKKNTEVVYNYLTIPRGGLYHIVLSDGTEVWLNSETKLKYPTAFVDGAERSVELIYGEAYFEVSPSTAHKGAKFKVVSALQEVQVLGTQFNIKAYKDENFIYTTLVEGKVAMIHGNQKDALLPEQQFILNTTNSDFKIEKVDVYSEIAWKKGLFSFKNKSLKDIMVVLARWYDVDFVFADKKLEDIQFKGVLSKNQNIEDILTLIKNTNFIDAYEINNNTITLKN